MNRRITLIPVIFYGIIFLSTMLNYGCKKNSSTDGAQSSWNLAGKIVFLGSGQSVSVIDMNSPSLTNSILTPLSLDAPQVSPDGTTIAYNIISPQGSVDIYLVNILGGSSVDLTPTAKVSEGAPAWSPDGSKVAFDAYDHQSGTNLIRIINRDGTNHRTLTDSVLIPFATLPRFSPDGNKIAYIGRIPKMSPWTYSLYTISTDGTQQVLLSQLGINSWNYYPPLWSPDSRKIAVGKEEQDLGDTATKGVYVIDAANKSAQKVNIQNVTLNNDGFAWFSSNELLCAGKAASDTTYSIYRVSTVSPYQSRMIVSGLKKYPALVISPDKNSIAIFSGVGTDSGVWLYTTQTDGTNFQKLKLIDSNNNLLIHQYSMTWVR